MITRLQMLVPAIPGCSIHLPIQISEHHLFAQLTACSSNIFRLSSADAEVFRQEALCYANSCVFFVQRVEYGLILRSGSKSSSRSDGVDGS